MCRKPLGDQVETHPPDQSGGGEEIGEKKRNRLPGEAVCNLFSSANVVIMKFILFAKSNFRMDPHPVPLPIRWGEGVRRTGEGFAFFYQEICFGNRSRSHYARTRRETSRRGESSGGHRLRFNSLAKINTFLHEPVNQKLLTVR
jgi:hypothetical protein